MWLSTLPAYVMNKEWPESFQTVWAGRPSSSAQHHHLLLHSLPRSWHTIPLPTFHIVHLIIPDVAPSAPEHRHHRRFLLSSAVPH